MAVGFDPRQPYTISLNCFKDVPETERPVWEFRRLNGAEFVQLNAAYEISPASTDEYQTKIFDCLQVGLIGWKNQTNVATGEIVDFDANRIAEITNVQEAWELIETRLTRGRISNDEKKT